MLIWWLVSGMLDASPFYERAKMLETDRRSFLKGLFATVALAAMPIPAAIAEVVAEVVPALPDAETGEIWLFIDGEWRLIGGATKWMYRIQRDSLVVGHRDGYTVSAPSHLVHHSISAEIVTDTDGMDMLATQFNLGKMVPAMFGIHGGRVSAKAAILSFETTVQRSHRGVMSVEFQLSEVTHK